MLPVSTVPISLELPVSTENTPAGMPARSARTANASADRGVWLAGRTTIGQPAAIAGAAFRVIIALGKFQGVIAAVTPIGSLVTRIRWSLQDEGMVSP